MLCFYCGSQLSNSDYCSNCGVKVTVFKKVIRMSNTYYNMGLVKASNRDLSGAADLLRRSLKLDKRNVRARNLLGLVYFEMGETVQAISEWVISQHFRPDKNPANGYIKSVQSNANKLEEMNHNIKKFNIALNYAKQGNDDMAIIQLKKVLNQNPHLIKGHQLLALLLMKNEEYDRAKKTINKALEIDLCNPLSLKYNKVIDEYLARNKKNIDKRQAKDPDTNRPYLSGNDVVIPPHSFRESTNGAITIINVIIGLVIGALAMYFLVTPVKVKNEVNKTNEIILDYSQKLAIKNSSMSELEGQVETLTNEKASLQKKLDKATSKDETTLKNYDSLLKALNSYIDEEYDAGAEAYKEIDTKTEMDSDVFNTIYNALGENLNEYLAESYFNAGETAYASGEYETAIDNYQKCFEIDKDKVEALYKTGWSYKNLGDTTNADKKFNEVASKFPNSEFATLAKNQISSND